MFDMQNQLLCLYDIIKPLVFILMICRAPLGKPVHLCVFTRAYKSHGTALDCLHTSPLLLSRRLYSTLSGFGQKHLLDDQAAMPH